MDRNKSTYNIAQHTILSKMWENMIKRVRDLLENHMDESRTVIKLPGVSAPWAYALCEEIISRDGVIKNNVDDIYKLTGRIDELENYFFKSNSDQINKNSKNISLTFRRSKDISDNIQEMSWRINEIERGTASKESTPPPDSPETSINTEIIGKKYEFTQKCGSVPNSILLDRLSLEELKREFSRSGATASGPGMFNVGTALQMRIYVCDETEKTILPFRSY